MQVHSLRKPGAVTTFAFCNFVCKNRGILCSQWESGEYSPRKAVTAPAAAKCSKGCNRRRLSAYATVRIPKNTMGARRPRKAAAFHSAAASVGHFLGMG